MCRAVEHVYPLVRSKKRLDRVLDEIDEAPCIDRDVDAEALQRVLELLRQR